MAYLHEDSDAEKRVEEWKAKYDELLAEYYAEKKRLMEELAHGAWALRIAEARAETVCERLLREKEKVAALEREATRPRTLEERVEALEERIGR